MLHFHFGDWNSVKSITIKKQSTIKITARFMSSKLLTYVKVSIAAFIYDVVDVVCFLNREVSEMYSAHVSFIYFSLIQATVPCSFFSFATSLVPLMSRRIENWFSGYFSVQNWKTVSMTRMVFFDNFSAWHQKVKKQVSFYEFEAIDNLNSREYFEKYCNTSVNKKYKGFRKNLPGMLFEAFTSLPLLLNEHGDLEKVKREQRKQNRPQVINGKMVMTAVNKSLFALLNNKWFHFREGILSLPIGIPLREHKKILLRKWLGTTNRISSYWNTTPYFLTSV